jgi:hydrogenase nickel incorporation protein HypA/HybF
VHEFAVCQGLMGQVEEIAQREQAERVTRIKLQIGPLSGVEPQLLATPSRSRRPAALPSSAALEIDSQPVRVRCLSCGAESDATPNKLVCRQCGDFRTQLISGDEMLLLSVELERRESA